MGGCGEVKSAWNEGGFLLEVWTNPDAGRGSNGWGEMEGAMEGWRGGGGWDGSSFLA